MLDNLGFNSWASHVKNLLYEEGFGQVWENQHCDPSVLLAFQNSVHESFVDTWKTTVNDVNKLSKLRTYSTFKCDIYMEPYLVNITNFKLRKILARFRLSNHSLAIEKGRHCKPKVPVELRVCKLCNFNCIEDEFHFLMVCPAYSTLRREFFNIREDLNLWNHDFINILNCEVTCFYLAKCIKKMFNLRDVMVSKLK